MPPAAESQWTFEGRPSDPGWYPVLMCWEPLQGTFVAAAEWPFAFNVDVAIVAFGPMCRSEAEALAWANQNSPPG